MNEKTEERERRHLVEYTRRSLDEEEEFHFLRFEFLHRLNITSLEVQLARLKSRVQRDSEISDDHLSFLRSTMHDYATALRDYHYMRRKKSLPATEVRDRRLLFERFFQSRDDFNNPFQSHYSLFRDGDDKIDPLRSAFMRYLPPRLTYSHEERISRKREFEDGKPPNNVSHFVDGLVRFAIAVTGGAFLVIPMLIMTLNQSVATSLITASSAVVLFSLVLSLGVRVTNSETLISTATYAAVLVVFVGTSTNGSMNE